MKLREGESQCAPQSQPTKAQCTHRGQPQREAPPGHEGKRGRFTKQRKSCGSQENQPLTKSGGGPRKKRRTIARKKVAKKKAGGKILTVKKRVKEREDQQGRGKNVWP